VAEVVSVGDLVVLPLPAHTVPDPVDDPGHDPDTALDVVAAALEGLGTMRVLGRVAGARSLAGGSVVALVPEDADAHRCVLLHWSDALGSVAAGDVVEVFGDWTLLEHCLVLEVEDFIALD
jgi:hypothetical protein